MNPVGASGLYGLSDLRGYARMANRYVIVGSIEVLDPAPNPDNQTHDEAAIWWSDNATTWHKAALPQGYASQASFVLGVTAGGPGFVAVGSGVPLWSGDGMTWVQGTGAGIDNVQFATVGSASDGVVAAGSDFDTNVNVAITSTDGKSWTKSDATSALIGTVVHFAKRDGGRLTAWVTKSTSKTLVYDANSAGAWSKLGSIGDSIDVAGSGPAGWVAIGRYAWVSTDGQTWTKAPTTPIVPLGSAQAIIGDSTGYVVATNVYPPGCAIDEGQIVGYTWTSVDGMTWHRIKASFKGRWMGALFIDGRTLVGVGQSHDSTQPPLAFGFVRTSDLPPAPPIAQVPPTPVPTPTAPPGCGP